MENYIYIDGKKIELTEEQVKELREIAKAQATIEGDIAKIGDYEFIVLEQDEDVVKLLLKNTWRNSKFGEENNNYKESTIAELLVDFAYEIANIVGAENLVAHTVDLTSDDGLKDYGTVNAKMSLLTCDMYRKYVYTIDKYKIDKWWWLATPCSTKTHDWETAVKCVSPSGDVNVNRYDGDDFGVRPFCILKSNIFVSK